MVYYKNCNSIKRQHILSHFSNTARFSFVAEPAGWPAWNVLCGVFISGWMHVLFLMIWNLSKGCLHLYSGRTQYESKVNHGGRFLSLWYDRIGFFESQFGYCLLSWNGKAENNWWLQVLRRKSWVWPGSDGWDLAKRDRKSHFRKLNALRVVGEATLSLGKPELAENWFGMKISWIRVF